MAGLEELEIHSRSYLVRWVNVKADFTISWSFQPRKRTINFGVFKHPGEGHGQGFKVTSSTTQHESPGSSDGAEEPVRAKHDKQEAGTIEQKLRAMGFQCIEWTGKCEADRATLGSFSVPAGGDGMYGLVFDNTHSKQFSKTVTFVLMTHPTSAPPTSQHRMHFAQAISGANNGPHKRSPRLGPSNHDSQDTIPKESEFNRVVLADPRPKSMHGTESVTSLGGSFYTGVLSKKRRKRNQGYARRFFSLDFTSSTLSYYKNKNSSALRGAIPLSLAAVGANEKSRQISVDSGTEIWLLRAYNKQDFEGWVEALERASRPKGKTQASSSWSSSEVTLRTNPAEEREWSQVESLVGRVAGITDAVRRLAKDTDPKYASSPRSPSVPGPAEGGGGDYFASASEPKQERQPFWRRKSSHNAGVARSPSRSRLAPPTPGDGQLQIPKRGSVLPDRADEGIHSNCMALLRDLENVVGDFSHLIERSKHRRTPARPIPMSRASMDSLASPQEFYDAEETKDHSPIYPIKRDADADVETPEADAVSINSASTADTVEAEDQPDKSYFPGRPKNLYPLPHDKVPRRTTVPAAKGAPPSLVGFLRKNVGKDLSTIAMPVTANEPLSLCQKAAENVEYADLLNTAAALTGQEESAATRRLLLIMAFALSPLSSARAKERAIRKPFNPMLGETYELVREDMGMRFIAEKISHRPVRIAYQAEGGGAGSKTASWTHTQAPAPSQKFWGKSAELITEGKLRVRLHEQRENYSWTSPNCFLRNIIAGEKYMEPVGTMTVSEESSGRRAVATFKAGGMFSGRSEDVTVEAFEGQHKLPLGLVGKWTTQLSLTDSSGNETEVVWKAGSMVNGAPARFGMTEYAATLNEETPLEKGALPPTDSRRRPDQRAYEEGDIDKAEDLKVKLEEGQRRRRKDMEGRGEQWEAKWFEKVAVTSEGEEIWKLREKDGYWDVREAVVGFKGGRWDGVREVFEL